MNKHSKVLNQQIEMFIDFIDEICHDPHCTGLTENNKKELRSAFKTIINTAQNEIIYEIALKLQTLNNKNIN